MQTSTRQEGIPAVRFSAKFSTFSRAHLYWTSGGIFGTDVGPVFGLIFSSGNWQTVRRIYKKEGLLGFYKG